MKESPNKIVRIRRNKEVYWTGFWMGFRFALPSALLVLTGCSAGNESGEDHHNNEVINAHSAKSSNGDEQVYCAEVKRESSKDVIAAPLIKRELSGKRLGGIDSYGRPLTSYLEDFFADNRWRRITEVNSFQRVTDGIWSISGNYVCVHVEGFSQVCRRVKKLSGHMYSLKALSTRQECSAGAMMFYSTTIIKRN